MRFIEETDSRQMRLGIWSIEEEVAENSPARFIEVFVDSLDVGELGFKRAEPAHTGRPAYAPQDLIKLYLYGYLNGIRSSRKLERECGRNIELFYLLNRLCPDHNTIADFRTGFAASLRRNGSGLPCSIPGCGAIGSSSGSGAGTRLQHQIPSSAQFRLWSSS